ncbi:MAG: hypothetical protein ACHQT7_01370 [Candidatus Levyibacteriota bacterium]
MLVVKIEHESSPSGVRRGRGLRTEIGDEPNFAGTFVEAAKGCGVKTLTEFSHGSGVIIDVLSSWVTGKQYPSPAKMKAAVSYLVERGASSEVIERLNAQYDAYRQERSDTYQKRNNSVAKRKRIHPSLPLGRFIDQLADNRNTTVSGLTRLMQVRNNFLAHTRLQKDMTQETLLKILAILEESGILTPDEKDQMEKAAADTKQQIIREKGRMIPVSTISIKRQQERHERENPSSNLLTGEEAGVELGISRVAVAHWRKRLKIENVLLTPEDLSSIRKQKIKNPIAEQA